MNSPLVAQILGPLGALAISLIGALVLWRQLQASSAALLRTLNESQAKIAESLEQAKSELVELYQAEIERLRAERDSLAKKLEREHAERLADAKSQSHELLETWRAVERIRTVISIPPQGRTPSDRPPKAGSGSSPSPTSTTTETARPR